MIKKVIILSLIICMCINLIGCGGNPVTPPIEEEEEGSTGVFTTDSSGNVQLYDSAIEREVNISIADNNSNTISGVEVNYISNGETIWIYCIDPTGVYFPQLFSKHVSKLEEGKVVSGTIAVVVLITMYMATLAIPVYMKVMEDYQFFPGEKGFGKQYCEDDLDGILAFMANNDWHCIIIGPKVLSKLGLENDPYKQYKVIFTGKDQNTWKDELINKGISENVIYQYGYYVKNNTYFLEQLADACQGDIDVIYDEEKESIKIVYLIDINNNDEEEIENEHDLIFEINHNPIEIYNNIVVSCNPKNPLSDNITWTWDIPELWSEPITTEEQDWIWWTVPSYECNFTIYCTIDDGINEYSGSVEIEVVNTHEDDTQEIVSVIREFELAMNNLNWNKAKSYCEYSEDPYSFYYQVDAAKYVYENFNEAPDYDVTKVSIDNIDLIRYEPIFYYDNGLTARIIFKNYNPYYNAEKISNDWKLTTIN
jgi:hypothetical protein